MADPPPADFVHLHVHSDYSLLDGACKCDRLMDHAHALGMRAVALTDHGNLFGLIDFYKNARKKGVKPLLGCELYLITEPDGADNAQKARIPIHHMGVLVQDLTGYRNLSKLVSHAYLHGFYRRPRCTLKTLAAHAEGLIGFSGCLQGVLPQLLLKGDEAGARKMCAKFVEIFGQERFLIEIQDHGLQEQKQIIPGLLKLAEDFGLKVVATNDTHYVEQADAKPHDALLCIQTGARLADEKRMRYAADQFYLKSEAEMKRLFGERPDSLTNTLEVAERCDVKLPFGENHYPVFETPADIRSADAQKIGTLLDAYVADQRERQKARGEDPVFDLPKAKRAHFEKNGAHLLRLVAGGLKERYGVDYDDPGSYTPQKGESADFAQSLVERIDLELTTIGGKGFIDYFLIVADFIGWARKEKIPVGPGRGSGAGSLVAYCTQITDIDPIRFGLLFERFLNPERESPPDFDIDFCMRRRDEVIEYVRRKYGEDCVANIVTFGTFGAKMIVRDLARIRDLSFAEGDRLAKMVPDDLGTTLDSALEKSHELAAEVKTSEVAADIVEQGKVIEGMVRSTGKHAAGIIIADRPLQELVPVFRQEGALTTQFPKDPVEELGLLKMDFLGLRTLTIIADAEENVRRTADPAFAIAEVSYEDQPTFDLLNAGKTVAVFQLESGGMQNLCRQFSLSSIDQIVALIALYRPGPMEWIPDYIEGARNPAKVKYAHPLLEDICRETYGVMVYQEQVMEAARVVAGYSLGAADILRRAMGKKKVEVMAEQEKIFVEGAKAKHGMDAKTAKSIFDILAKFAGYGFNKSHSAAYAILGYQTAYLKANYPVQFMAAVLSAELGNADKVAHFLDECGAMSIEVLGPDVNESRVDFTPVVDSEGHGHIRFGLGAIKGVGAAVSEKIAAEREENGPFQSFRDFASRLPAGALNKRVVECLVKAGAFDAMGYDRGALLYQNPALAPTVQEDDSEEAPAGESEAGGERPARRNEAPFWFEGVLDSVAGLQKDRAAGQGQLFDDLLGQDALSGPADELPAVTMPKLEKLQYEKDLLGFFVSGHPLDDFAGMDTALSTLTREGLETVGDRAVFRLCGVLGVVQKKISKKDNRTWAILQLSTRESTFEMQLFPEAYAKYAELAQPGRVVLATGTVRKRDDRTGLGVDHLQELSGAVCAPLLHKVTWQLKDPAVLNGEIDTFLEALRAEVDRQNRQGIHGRTQLELAFPYKDGWAVAEAKPSLTLELTPEVFTRLKSFPAVARAELEAAAPKAPERPRWAKNGD